MPPPIFSVNEQNNVKNSGPQTIAAFLPPENIKKHH